MTTAIDTTVALSLLRRLCADGTARQVREASALSLGEVASTVGVSKASLSAWERGLHLPRGEHAVRYAELIGVLSHLNDEPGANGLVEKEGEGTAHVRV